MAHENYEKAIRQVYVGLGILAVITLIEVGVSLFGKGHLVSGVEDNKWVIIIAALLIIGLSLYKAKFIIYEFMHMRYEVPGLVRTVLLPVVLLLWAIVAFFWEGSAWKARRAQIDAKNELPAKKAMGDMLILDYEWSKEDLQ